MPPIADPATLADRVRTEFGARVPADLVHAGVTDPGTGLVTVLQNLPMPWPAERYLEAEFAVPDVNKLTWLARQAPPVGLLSAATGGNPAASPRYRHLLRPSGIAHELRVALVYGGLCWGYVVLLRGHDRPDFTAAETRLVRSAVPALASALRAGLLADGPVPAAADVTGVALVGADGLLEEASPAALSLFARLSALHTEIPLPVPLPVATMTASFRAPGAPDRRRILLRDPGGGWLELTGSRLADRGPTSRCVFAVTPAAPAVLAPMLLQANGLTERQVAVGLCVLRGMTTAEIAETLAISVHTVQDHLKANFAKSGVRSRREFARTFLSPLPAGDMA